MSIHNKSKTKAPMPSIPFDDEITHIYTPCPYRMCYVGTARDYGESHSRRNAAIEREHIAHEITRSERVCAPVRWWMANHGRRDPCAADHWAAGMQCIFECVCGILVNNTFFPFSESFVLRCKTIKTKSYSHIGREFFFFCCRVRLWCVHSTDFLFLHDVWKEGANVWPFTMWFDRGEMDFKVLCNLIVGLMLFDLYITVMSVRKGLL